MRRAIVKISGELLIDRLGMPSDTEVVGSIVSEGGEAAIVVEHQSLPIVAENETPPLASPMIRGPHLIKWGVPGEQWFE